jgi:PAS domain S-box-containing protein
VSPAQTAPTAAFSGETARHQPGVVRFAAGACALAAGHYLLSQLGPPAVLAAQTEVPPWPPLGLAVAVLFRAGLRYWPGVFGGSLACGLSFAPFWAAAGIAAGTTLGVVLAAALLRRSGFDRTFAGRRDLFAFLLAMLVGATVAANNGVLWLTVGGGVSPERMAAAWLVWLLGGAASVLVVGPAVLAGGLPRRARDVYRLAGALAVTGGLTALAFSGVLPPAFRSVLVFPPIMLLIWVGMNQRLAAGSLHVVVLSTVAAVATANGHGFSQLPPLSKLILLWATASTAALVVLALCATMAQRERAEAALAASAAEYQALVDGTPAAIVRYTADGTLTFVNATLCRLLGRRRESLIGRSVLNFIPDLPRAEGVTDLPVTQPTSGPAADASGVIRKPDGSCRWYRWTARRITGPGGRPEFQAVGIDLTERRQAEADRAAIERKMQDAQRLEALGVLAGGVAHDFNNLLAGVLGHAELAVGELPPDHPAREHLATVLSGVAQAGGLTRQLLAYSGKGRFLLRPLDLNDLIRQTTELLRLTLPKKVQLVLELAEPLPRVTADDGQLRQVLMNLLINAGEAIGDRPGTVRVATTAHLLSLDVVSGSVYSPAAPGQFVELVVSDTGCGMDEATKARLFDPFFTTKFAGRGLGLSAVLGIVRGHGGGIRVDSRPCEGTRFTVLLPAVVEALSVTETPAPHDTPPPRHRPASLAGVFQYARAHGTAGEAPSPSAAGQANGSSVNEAGKLALVVDDEPTVRQVGELMLRQLGYEVVTAANGQEALDLFDAHAARVKLVLLDLTMPVMDGAEALAAIRERSAAVPVILCSGYAAEAVPESLGHDGVTGFLQKPYARGDLQHALAAVGA